MGLQWDSTSIAYTLQVLLEHDETISLINMCMGNYWNVGFPIQNDLKQTDALLQI